MVVSASFINTSKNPFTFVSPHEQYTGCTLLGDELDYGVVTRLYLSIAAMDSIPI